MHEGHEGRPLITKTRLQWRKADLAIGKSGVEATETTVGGSVVLEEHDIELPDVLTDLQDKTQLTRRSISRILTASGRLDDFKRNPSSSSNSLPSPSIRAKRMAIVDGIKYHVSAKRSITRAGMFEQEELTGYLKKYARPTSRFRTCHYDSDTSSFCEQLEKMRLSRFTPSSPAGSRFQPAGPYNPDWACWL